MSDTFDERWSGLWVCDDGRAVRIERAADALHLAVTDAQGASLAALVAAFVAPDPVRTLDADCAPAFRLGRLRADVGEGITAQTYTLYVAALDAAPGAKFRYRPARGDDALSQVQLLPECGPSMLEMVADDPWSNPDYGTVGWALPYLPFTHVDAWAALHPLVRPTSSYWEVSVAEAAPAGRSGRAVDAAEARSWCEARCGRCGSAGVEVAEARDDSGTGWRQLFVTVRCGRCARWTTWHYND